MPLVPADSYEFVAGTIFVTILAMVLIWFVLCTRLFKRLERLHPAVYERMGRITLIKNNTIKNGWLFLKFLVGCKWRHLKDPPLHNLCAFMVAFFVVYSLLFASLFLIGVTSDPRLYR